MHFDESEQAPRSGDLRIAEDHEEPMKCAERFCIGFPWAGRFGDRRSLWNHAKSELSFMGE